MDTTKDVLNFLFTTIKFKFVTFFFFLSNKIVLNNLTIRKLCVCVCEDKESWPSLKKRKQWLCRNSERDQKGNNWSFKAARGKSAPCKESLLSSICWCCNLPGKRKLWNVRTSYASLKLPKCRSEEGETLIYSNALFFFVSLLFYEWHLKIFNWYFTKKLFVSPVPSSFMSLLGWILR